MPGLPGGPIETPIWPVETDRLAALVLSIQLFFLFFFFSFWHSPAIRWGLITMFPQCLWSITLELFNCINLGTWGHTPYGGPQSQDQTVPANVSEFTQRGSSKVHMTWTRVGAEPQIRWQKWLQRNLLVTLPAPWAFQGLTWKTQEVQIFRIFYIRWCWWYRGQGGAVW